MAHQSNKFVSFNLNKSYGQPPTFSSPSAFGHGRNRHGGGGGGGGGGGSTAGSGMVVLSRPRSSGTSAQRAPSKLSVPPPLNLPSLRKEHERFDPSSASGVSARPGSSGFGLGSASSTMGWTKPTQGSAYVPPGSSAASQPLHVSSLSATVEKAVFLPGEEFPSLRATIASGLKQKDTANSKQKQKLVGGDDVRRRIELPELQSSPLDMRPQMRSSHLSTSNVSGRDESSSRQKDSLEQSSKQDAYFPGPLPLVRLSHTSDWADDERDTGLSLPERGADRGFSRPDPARLHDVTNGGNAPSKEFRGHVFGRDLGNSRREMQDVGTWRTQQAREGSNFRESGADRNRVETKSFGVSREVNKESNNSNFSRTGNAWDSANSGHDTWFGGRDLGSGTGIENGRNLTDKFYGRSSNLNQHATRYRGETFQNTIPKDSFSSGGADFSLNNSILKFGREKQVNSNSGKPYLDDASLDHIDPFSGGLMGEVNVKVFKKKKDLLKQADFHDPVRESFEAELERVQKIQEMERQKVMEEQARNLEIARREREERDRLAREEEERRRRLDEEAREAVWRAEHERLEAAKRAEEQKIAREEERRRADLEEERRKEAARRKLLELEARMAKRQAEAMQKSDKSLYAFGDERSLTPTKEMDGRVADVAEWEDRERMVEHITSTASSDSSSMNAYFDTGSRPQSSTDDKSSFTERGKHGNYWRRDANGNGNSSVSLLQDQDNGNNSSRSFISGRDVSRKEIHGNLPLSVRSPFKVGASEPPQASEHFHHARGSRWKVVGDGDHFSRRSDTDAEFFDNDKFGDGKWRPDHSHGSPYNSYAERSYQNPEVDGFSSSGRSRYSLRQPRVLPPPSVSIRRDPFAASGEHPNSSTLFGGESRYQPPKKTEETGYGHAYQEQIQQPATTAPLLESTVASEQKEGKDSLRCDSQSSLSVSSPPSSPTQVSHDGSDASEDSQELPTSPVGEQTALSTSENVLSSMEVGNINSMVNSSLISHVDDDDDEWGVGKHETVQEQEEYDEDEDGYQEEEEAHEGNDENADLAQEFDDMQSDVADIRGEEDHVVLGFNEGVEVRIPIVDDFEKTSRDNGMTVGLQAGSVSALQELITSDMPKAENTPEEAVSGTSIMINESEQTVQDLARTPSEEAMSGTSKIINESAQTVQDLVLDPGAATTCAPDTSYTADTVGAINNSGMPAQQLAPFPSSSPIPSASSVQPLLLSNCNVTGKPDVPTLHFGLFSGPSLIPLPVPAIQIGSIQMPLHLHPQVGPSITQTYSSQPPFFQFGQLRCTPPISQGVLPLSSQTMSFIEPSTSANYSLSQNIGGNPHKQASQKFPTANNLGDKVVPAFVPINKQPNIAAKHLRPSQNNIGHRQANATSCLSKKEATSHSQTGILSAGEVKNRFVSACGAEHHGKRDVNLKKSYRPVGNNREPSLHAKHHAPQFFPREKNLHGLKVPGMVSCSRGKGFAYAVRNAGSRPLFPGPETSRADSSNFHRRHRRNIRKTEFRALQNIDRRQVEAESKSAGLDGKPNFKVKVSGNPARYGGKKDAVLSKLTKTTIESEKVNSRAVSPQLVVSDGNKEKFSSKEAAPKKRMPTLQNSNDGQGNMRSNASFEENVEAPLQSGVVHVYKQPGIEAPSDEDDFIQVRSKRQMLIDRREQKEKEIKAKSMVIKMYQTHQKQCAVSHSNAAISNSNRVVSFLGRNTSNKFRSNSVIYDGRGVASVASIDASPVFALNISSQSLPPIGTPTVNVDSGPKSRNSDTKSRTLKSCQPNAVPSASNVGTKFRPSLSFESKNEVIDNASNPLGSWDITDASQQVMSLTQSQLDEAMQISRFDSTSNIAHEPIKSSTTVVMQEKPLSSASSLNSLLAGEKIQFGAVTSPTILPPVSQAVSNGIGPPGPGRSDVAIGSKLPGTESECPVFFDKEKRCSNSCAHIDDHEAEAEAEAEAAASAVAVAAISHNDDIVGSGFGSCSVSVSDIKNFSGSDATAVASKAGITASQEIACHSSTEDSLTVSLPADLSVENPSPPLWPHLPSTQTSTAPILSHFAAAPPSHFPCFEMNPMVGGPIFAFGPHDESGGTQAQPQGSTTLGSGPIAAWPQCHSNMDSFCAPPAGFSGPFISPPGGIPGVQGPHHMVVYNHFTPVGQFGQVGLSFMGTTYISTAKQPDWKHNPISSAVGVSQGDISSLNIVSGQCNPPSMPTPIHHMPTGPPLVPVASPITMFDLSPFQPSGDIPMQARWSHISGPQIHSVPLSIPLHQHQVEGTPSQFSRSLPVDTSAGNSKFNQPPLSTIADGNRNFPVSKDASRPFLDELGLMELPAASSISVKTIAVTSRSASGNDNKGLVSSKGTTSTMVSAGQGGIGTNSINKVGQTAGPSVRTQVPHQSGPSDHQCLHPTGYTDQRSWAPQKTGSAGEWHRRMGYQGKNPSSGSDKNFASSKVKQIYVAKAPTSGLTTTG